MRDMAVDALYRGIFSVIYKSMVIHGIFGFEYWMALKAIPILKRNL